MSDNLVLNLGENCIRIADIRTEAKQMEITALTYQDSARSILIDDSEKGLQNRAKLIEKLVLNLKTKKKGVKVVIPDGLTFSQIIEMPRLREKELLSAIKYQADQFIPMPLDETVIDLEILYEDKVNKKLLVLIVASPQKLIGQITDTIAMSGLYPESIENELSAIGRFLSFYSQTTDIGSTIFFNLGFQTSSLYFYNPKLKLITDIHNYKLGYQLFLKELEINTNLDPEKGLEAIKKIGLTKDGSIDTEAILKPVIEELVKEIAGFTITIKEKYSLPKIDQICLINLASSVNNIALKIQSYLGGIPVSLFNISSVIKKNPISQSLNNEFSSFISLAGATLE